MTLQQLEKINGGPFVLTGFGWDYGGMVASWERGRLNALWRSPRSLRAISVRLEPEQPWGASYAAMAGEGEDRSNDPAMHRLNPRIVAIAAAPR